jgi:hypothetical protein
MIALVVVDAAAQAQAQKWPGKWKVRPIDEKGHRSLLQESFHVFVVVRQWYFLLRALDLSFFLLYFNV